MAKTRKSEMPVLSARFDPAHRDQIVAAYEAKALKQDEFVKAAIVAYVQQISDTTADEVRFLATMAAFYRRATEAEREMLLQIADPERLMERQRQAAERALARLDAEKAS